jgi:hypothetical protein
MPRRLPPWTGAGYVWKSTDEEPLRRVSKRDVRTGIGPEPEKTKAASFETALL